MSRPETITLSAAAGEAIIERLSVYAPSRADCERLIQVLRWYFWLAAAVKEAKLSLKKLRTLLLGQGPKPPTLCEPAASSVSASSRGDGEVSGDGSARDEEGGRSTEAGSKPESVASAAETSKPRGGHRPGTGRLGADAYKGAERVECRHEALAVGQRCPVCGQGTLYGAGCEFSVAQTLLACAPVEGNSFIRARCGQNNACGSVAAHGRECACSRCFFVHTLLISCPGVCQLCPTTSRRSSDVQNLQPAPSLVDGRRKKLLPNLRRFVVDFDLKVSEGRVARNVLSESMSAQ
jgi:hypothetical protein